MGDNYRVVMHLIRWQRTSISLSFKERLAALFTGRLDLDESMLGDSIGWVPVFENEQKAQTYVQTEAPGAQILETRPELQL